MRVALDGNEANTTYRVGSNMYAFELLVALEKITRGDTETTVTVLLSKKKADDLPAERKGWTYRVVKPSPFWTQYALPIHLFLNRKKYDVFFTPGHYGPRVSPVPYISSVMDLAFLYFPKQFRRKDLLQLTEWTRYSVHNAKRIIAISEHTKKDVIEAYHVPEKKVVVAYPGFNRNVQVTYKEKEKIATLKKWKIHQPFIVYVGTIQPRKNLLRLIEAFEVLVKKSDSHTVTDQKLQSLQLVIAGKVGWLASDVLKRMKESPVHERIIFTGYVTETEKTILYKESICTVLVGLYEGFGIPALEAMAYGSIPLVSETTSLPEVVGKAGELVNPLDTLSIAEGIKKVMNRTAKEHGKLLKLGREQVKKFNWDESAKRILETLHEVVEERKK